MSLADTVAIDTSALHLNPFNVLGATTRDKRQRIIELEEERSLVADEAACRDARNALTTPRTRLGAEMGWLPGIAPRKAAQVVEDLPKAHPGYGADLPPLARANVQAAVVERLAGETDLAVVQDAVSRLASAVDEIDPAEVLRDLNEDRSVAGFPEVRDEEAVATELEARKRYYRSAVTRLLDRLPSKSLVKVMHLIVRAATENGAKPSPAVVADLVDAYETASQGFLERQAKVLGDLLARMRETTPLGEAAVGKVFDQVEAAVRVFTSMMRPIQMVRHADGQEHSDSTSLATALRGFVEKTAVPNDWIELSTRITEFVAAQFPFVGVITDFIASDREFLSDAKEERKLAKERDEEFRNSITYSAELGTLFKETVGISPDGIRWKGEHMPLERVSRLRWGGTRHSVNGIPTGTTFMIFVGSPVSSFTISMKNQQVYGEMIDRIWRAVGVRLMFEIVHALKQNGSVSIAGTTLRDDGIVLFRRKMFGADESVLRGWNQVHVWNHDGCFVIGDKEDKKVYVRMNYQTEDNVHVLENLIRFFFKSSKPRLSQLFN